MNDSTKNCDEIIFLLDAYHDKELTLPEKKLVESHLAHCQPCQERLKQIESLVSSLKSLPILEASADLTRNLDSLLLTKSVAPQAKVIPFNRYQIALAASAACAAIIFLTIQFLPKASVQVAITAEQHNLSSKAKLTAKQEIAQSTSIEPKVSINKNDNESKAKNNTAEKKILADKEKLATTIKAEPRLPTKATTDAVAVATNTSDNLPPLNNPIAVAPQQPASDEPAAEIASVYEGEPRGTAESIGIATDEDGLYALKL